MFFRKVENEASEKVYLAMLLENKRKRNFSSQKTLEKVIGFLKRSQMKFLANYTSPQHETQGFFFKKNLSGVRRRRRVRLQANPVFFLRRRWIRAGRHRRIR